MILINSRSVNAGAKIIASTSIEQIVSVLDKVSEHNVVLYDSCNMHCCCITSFAHFITSK